MTDPIQTDISYLYDERPLVCIAVGKEKYTEADLDELNSINELSNRIREAGGNACVLPFDFDSVQILNTVSRCDAVIVLSVSNEESDIPYEQKVIQACLRLNTPLIAIGSSKDLLKNETGLDLKDGLILNFRPNHRAFGLNSTKHILVELLRVLVHFAENYRLACQLHEHEIVLDGYADFRSLLDDQEKMQISKIADGRVDYLCVPIVPEKKAMGFTSFLKQIDSIPMSWDGLDHAPEIISNLDDSFGYKMTGTVGVILGAHPDGLVESIEQLHQLADKQVKFMSLRSLNGQYKLSTTPLSDLEKSLIKEMNKIGMTIDVSGCSESVINEILHLSSQPVIATQARYGKQELEGQGALTKRIIKKISKAEGIVLVAPPYTSSKSGSPTIEDYAKEIVSVADFCDFSHLGIATGPRAKETLGLHNLAGLLSLTEELLHTRMYPFELAMILGRNVLTTLANNETHMERFNM